MLRRAYPTAVPQRQRSGDVFAVHLILENAVLGGRSLYRCESQRAFEEQLRDVWKFGVSSIWQSRSGRMKPKEHAGDQEPSTVLHNIGSVESS
jgi:hypothetical protein